MGDKRPSRYAEVAQKEEKPIHQIVEKSPEMKSDTPSQDVEYTGLPRSTK
jgi:hypothetical protein